MVQAAMQDGRAGRGYVIGQGTTTPVDVAGHMLSMLAVREQTGGALSVFEARNVPSTVADRHIHHDAVKGSYILEGTYRWYLGEDEFVAGPGSFVLVPRHVAHHFATGPEGGRQLFIFSPAGLEHYMMEAAQAMVDGRFDEAASAELCSRYDVEPVELP